MRKLLVAGTMGAALGLWIPGPGHPAPVAEGAGQFYGGQPIDMPSASPGTIGRFALQEEAPQPTAIAEAAQTMPTDIPWQAVGWGVLGLVAGAGVARTARGYQVRTLARPELTAADTAHEVLDWSLAEAGLTAASLSTDDIARLRHSLVHGRSELSALQAARTKLADTYATERRRLWPNRMLVADRASDTADKRDAAAASTEVVEAQHSEVSALLQVLRDRRIVLGTKLAEVSSIAEGLVADDWVIDGFMGEIERFRQVQREVDDLCAGGSFLEPGYQVRDVLGEIPLLQKDMQALPERRVAADADYQRQPKLLAATKEAVVQATDVLAHLRATYDASCYEDLAQSEAEMAQFILRLERIQRVSGGSVARKTQEAVERSERLHTIFWRIAKDTSKLAEQATLRLQELEAIQRELPGDLLDVAGLLALATAYAAEQPDDVEASTRQVLADMMDKLAVAQQGLTVERPAYRELDSRRIYIQRQTEHAYRRAQAQRAEMAALRAEITQLEPALRKRLELLAGTYGSHAKVSPADRRYLREATIAAGDTRAPRAALRAQVIAYKDKRRFLDHLEQRAQQDIAVTKQKRRRIRI